MYKKLKVVFVIVVMVFVSIGIYRRLDLNAGVPIIDIEVSSQEDSDKYIMVNMETTRGKCVETSNISDVVITYNIGKNEEKIIVEDGEYKNWVVCGEKSEFTTYPYDIPPEATNIQVTANYFSEPIYSNIMRITNDKLIIENAHIKNINETSIQFEITLKNISELIIPINVVNGIVILEHGKNYVKNDELSRLAYYPEGETYGYIYPPWLSPVNTGDIDTTDSQVVINPGESYTFTSSVLISDLEKAEINYENGLDFVYYEPNTGIHYIYELDSNE